MVNTNSGCLRIRFYVRQLARKEMKFPTKIEWRRLNNIKFVLYLLIYIYTPFNLFTKKYHKCNQGYIRPILLFYFNQFYIYYYIFINLLLNALNDIISVMTIRWKWYGYVCWTIPYMVRMSIERGKGVLVVNTMQWQTCKESTERRRRRWGDNIKRN